MVDVIRIACPPGRRASTRSQTVIDIITTGIVLQVGLLISHISPVFAFSDHLNKISCS